MAEIHIPAPNSLPGLPTDILLCIADYLPLPSASLLPLCSKSLLAKLGSAHFSHIERGRRRLRATDGHIGLIISSVGRTERLAFLSLLERDYDDVVCCCFCEMLHRARYLVNTRSRNCSDSGPVWGDSSGPTFSRLYHAMKRYHQGSGLDDILGPVSKTITHYRTNWTHQRIFTPRVISGKLHLRTQHWILLSPDLAPNLPPGFFRIKICHHVRNIHAENPCRWPLTTILRDRLRQYAGLEPAAYSLPSRAFMQGCLTCRIRPASYSPPEPIPWGAYQRCQVCSTEFRVEVREIEGRGVALVITVWQDFGNISKPDEKIFNMHTLQNADTRRMWFWPDYPREIIKMRFEGEHFEYKAHHTDADLADLRIKECKERGAKSEA